MRRFLRVLGLGFLAVVLVAVVAVTGLLSWVTGRAMPQVSGSLAVAGLHAPVEVRRDLAGVVHIRADTPHDLFLAQGYVHAQERLWQMTVWRWISAGRLAEFFGPTQLRVDRFIRTLGWRAAAERDLAAVAPDVREALEAYAAGVNAFVDAHRGSLGLAFLVAGLRRGDGFGGYVPEPWSPLDSMAWAKVQAWNLGGNFDTEVFRLLADARLGDPALTDALFPPYPAGAPFIVDTPGAAAGAAAAAGTAPAATERPAARPARTDQLTAPLDPEVQTALADLLTLAEAPSALAGFDAAGALSAGHAIGSQNWVVAPRHSTSGRALLANDPHLGAAMPSIWFMNGLHCRTVGPACPFDVAGVSFPGVPAVVLGRNARMAWGATNANPDVQDLFFETVDPADPGRYLHTGPSKGFGTRVEVIKVAGGDDVVLNIRETIHGPVLNDVDPRLAGAPLLALAWTGTTFVDRTVEAVFRLNTAATYDDFRAALSVYGSPAQNFVYADVDGHIGYQLPGAIPIRTGGGASLRPAPGDGSADWLGTVAFDELPRLLDPPSGMIVTANNAMTDPAAAGAIGGEFDPGDRALRAIQLLEAAAATGGVSTDEMARIQLDDLVLRGTRIVPLLERTAPATVDGRLLLDRVRAWDGHCGVESVGCAAYMALEYGLQRELLDPRLGLDLAREYIGGASAWPALVGLLGRPNDAWWDDPGTAARENAATVTSRAFDRVGRELRAAFGSPVRWTWGRLHTVTFQEQTFGTSGIGPLEWYFNAGPFPAAGAAGALNATNYRMRRAYPDPADPAFRPVGIERVFDVTNLPSYRQVFDLQDLDGGRFVQTTGNAGNPFDRHYGDLIDDWLAGRLVPLWFTPDAVADHAVTTLTLTP